MDDKNLYASPQADVDVDNTGKLASRSVRLLGAIIDGLVATLIITPAMYFSGYFQRAMEDSISLFDVAFWPVFGVAVYIALNGYLLATSGQTIGKRIVGTRIVSVEDGKILPFSKVIMLRVLPFTVLAQVPGVGPFAGIANVLFIYGPQRRCLHDYLAGTRVVET